MMKFALVAVAALSLAACGSNDGPVAENASIDGVDSTTLPVEADNAVTTTTTTTTSPTGTASSTTSTDASGASTTTSSVPTSNSTTPN